jgi:hypothetical protein
MERKGSNRIWRGLMVAVVALTAACDVEAPTGAGMVGVAQGPASVGAPQLGSCDSLAAPEGTKLSFHTFATGDQIYRWNGTSWVFVAPSADLFADATATGAVGTHFAGPTWLSNSGSAVVGAVAKRCPAPGNAIPWLLLSAVSSTGPGIFDGTTHIQRLNTVGGSAPAEPGSFLGEERRVPYTADYYFYRGTAHDAQ